VLVGVVSIRYTIVNYLREPYIAAEYPFVIQAYQEHLTALRFFTDGPQHSRLEALQQRNRCP
jgi:hypothetical protein